MAKRNHPFKVSCTNSYKKRSTQFKKGWSSKKEHDGGEETTTQPKPSASGCSELKRERLTSDEAADLAGISSCSSLPYSLRPKPVADEFPGIDNLTMDENVIVNMRRVTQLVESVHGFTCQNPKVKVKIVQRMGLCVSFVVTCSTCRLSLQPMQMSDTIKKSKGPPAGVLNEMAVLPALKTKVGLTDITNVFTCLNIKAPSKSLMQQKFNKMCDRMTELNERQLESNQAYLQHLTSLLQTEQTVDAQFDVSYSSRPQGGCEKAEQSFAALIEHTSTKKLPIAIGIANKHCRLKGCDHSQQKCAKNYSSDHTIAASERSLLHKTLNDVRNRGLITLRSVTTDASAQVAKALRDYETGTNSPITHQICFIHRLRTLYKHIRAVQLRSIPDIYDKDLYRQRLARCIRNRIRLELDKARAVTKTDDSFIQAGASAIQVVMKCLSGEHRLCREFSFVCISHLAAYTTTHLPYGVHLELSESELCLLQNEINKMFNGDSLLSMRKLFNTNQCESLHAAVYRLAPKTTCWTRNFRALCHSAAHSRSIGPSKSCIRLAQEAGIPVYKKSRLYSQLKLKEQQRQYDSRRSASSNFKQRRYYLRKRKSHRALFRKSLYCQENIASHSAQDHSYGISS